MPSVQRRQPGGDAVVDEVRGQPDRRRASACDAGRCPGTAPRTCARAGTTGTWRAPDRAGQRLAVLARRSRPRCAVMARRRSSRRPRAASQRGDSGSRRSSGSSTIGSAPSANSHLVTEVRHHPGRHDRRGDQADREDHLVDQHEPPAPVGLGDLADVARGDRHLGAEADALHEPEDEEEHRLSVKAMPRLITARARASHMMTLSRPTRSASQPPPRAPTSMPMPPMAISQAMRREVRPQSGISTRQRVGDHQLVEAVEEGDGADDDACLHVPALIGRRSSRALDLIGCRRRSCAADRVDHRMSPALRPCAGQPVKWLSVLTLSYLGVMEYRTLVKASVN